MTEVDEATRNAFYKMRGSGLVHDTDDAYTVFTAGFVNGAAWAIRTSSKIAEVLPLLRDFTTALEKTE
jgi:hypothetical protein